MPSGNSTAAAPSQRTAKPVRFRDLDLEQWKALAKAIWDRFGEVQITDRAAAITYYGILSLFPGLLVVVAVLALVGEYPGTYESIVSTLHDTAPGAAVDAIDSALRSALSDRGSAGPLLAVGLLLSIYSASGAIGAGMRALESINRVSSGRSFFPSLAIRLGLTLLLMLLVLIAFLAVVVAGPLFGTIADGAGFEGFFKHLVGYVRWPIGVLALLTAFTLVYSLGPRKGPRRGTRSVRSVLPGAVLGAALWFASSLAFTAYVSHFGSYDKTYGTLGALISLLIWLWLGNLAFLLGALFNAESERIRGGGR